MVTLVLVDAWSQAEPVVREKAYRTLENDPQVLLEQDAWFDVAGADVILARLFGLEDEIMEDGLRLRRVEPRILRPLIRPLTLADMDGPCEPVVPRVATYVLQSGFARVQMDAMYAPSGVEVGPDHRFGVLYLRYRRRL